jgi:hypothetical protein
MPLHVGAQVFAAHKAVGCGFDLWAVLSGNTAITIAPKQYGLRRDPNLYCQAVRIPGGLDCYLNWCHAYILHM